MRTGLMIGSDREHPRGERLSALVAEVQAAEKAGLRGTPSFLIGASGGTMTRFSATDSASFDEAIEGLEQR